MKKIYLFLFFVLLYFPVKAQDSLALVALYNATDGANWKNNSGWLTDNIDNWYGVTIDSDGRVVDLELNDNGLNGSIPASIGNLANLQGLYLSDNKLSGEVPDEIGNLTKLTALNLGFNQLSGNFPSSLLSLSNLELLFLCGNQFTGDIPAELGNLTKLTALDLFNNQFTGTIPAELGKLTNLTGLDVFGNQLSGSIPVELGNLTNLTRLDLSENQLSGTIPVELGNLTKLTELYLSGNQLSESVPAELGNLTDLKFLYLSTNQLSGSIPAEFASLTKLENLFLFENRFDELPDLSALTSLTECMINDNKFDFGDLEAAKIVSSNYIYSPQAKVGTEQDYSPAEGENVELTVTTGGTGNSYQWFKDGTEITGATGSSLTITSYSNDSDAGTYTCRITNSAFPDLMLETENYNLQNTATAIAPAGKSNEINVYLDQHNDILNIVPALNANNLLISIYNIAGQKVYSETIGNLNPNQKYRINMSGMENGIFIIQLSSGEFKTVKKIVKQ